jgi:hypothetical protein
MNENETHPRAAVMLADAGWTPHPKWGVFTRGTLVMGGDLMGGFHVKDWGMDLHGPDTPDTAEEAAAWLVQRFAIPADVVTLDYEPEPAEAPEPIVDNIAEEREAGQDAAHETHGETGEEAASDELLGELSGSETSSSDDADAGAGSGVFDEDTAVHEPTDLGADKSAPIDANFTLPEIDLIPPDPDPEFGAELLEWEGELAAKSEPEASGAFIFGDNLDQKRTAAIGLVVQAAIVRMPEPIDYAVLSELRNFTLGVSEGRWPDDPAQRAELDVLEARERRRRAIETARDDKTAFLVSATREQIEAFDPESDWP